MDEITYLDTIVDEDVAISITHTGYIKRTSIASYRSQRRGGRGRMGMKTKEEDFVDQLFIASTHSYILIFTDRGRVYWLKVHEIPDVGPQGKGKAVVNLVQLAPQEKPAAFVAAKEFVAGRYVLLATRKGIVKKTELDAFSNPRPSGIIALGVEDDDALIEAVLTAGTDEVLLATRDGMAIHFPEDDVRPMGRAAYGVKGIALEGGGRGGGAGGRLRRRHRAHGRAPTGTASGPPSTSTGCRAAAGRGSSTSRPRAATVPWWA